MTQIETPAALFMKLYNEYIDIREYNIQYLWSKNSMQRVDDMLICISELTAEALMEY